MKLVNKKLKHAAFGEGKIINQEDQRITVQFSEQFGTKQFVYPDAFEKYLKLFDADLEVAVMNEIHSKQVKMNDEKEKKQQLYASVKESEKLKLEEEKKSGTRKRKAK